MIRGCTAGLLCAPWLAVAACGASSSGGDDAGVTDAPAFDEDAGPGMQGSGYIFDPSVIRTYEFVLPAAAWQALQTNALQEQYVTTTLRFEGEEVANVGLRFKGAVGSLQNQGPIGNLRPCFDGGGSRNFTNCPKLGMKASFNEFVTDRKWNGLRKLQFHSMGSDVTKMVEHISYALFREMGVFAPRTAYARLIINGELQGFYILVEQIDGRFTRDRFPDGGQGNLYKEVWPVHAQPGPYLNALKTNENENPSADKMVRFAAALAVATDSTFEQVLEDWTDVDMLMNKMAVDRAIEHWDGIVAWYCFNGGCVNHNYYWYESTIEDKVWLIPWDLDRAMVWPPPIRTLYGMPDWDDASSCQQVPLFFPGLEGLPPACDGLIGSLSRVLWSRYAAATQVLLDGPFSDTAMTARIDAIESLIASGIGEDPWLNQATWAADVARFRLDVAEMRAAIQAKISN